MKLARNDPMGLDNVWYPPLVSYRTAANTLQRTYIKPWPEELGHGFRRRCDHAF